MKRRQFLVGISAMAASNLVVRATDRKQPSDRFPTDPRSRLAVATYPFRVYMIARSNRDRDPALPGMDLQQFAKFLVAEYNVHGIEPLHSHFASTETNYIKALRASFDQAGVHTVDIPVDVKVRLCSTDRHEREIGFATYRRWIDIASMLGSPSIRIQIPRSSEPQTLDTSCAVRALTRLAVYGAEKNIVINIENDNPKLDNAARVVEVLERVDSPFVRALPDFANSLMGGDEAFNARAVADMFRYAFNVTHVKDSEDINGKVERVNLETLFSIAQAANFRGYFSMESDTSENPRTATHRLINASMAFLQQKNHAIR